MTPRAPLAYRNSDVDHANGGHCIQLPGTTLDQQRWDLAHMYRAAFSNAAGHAWSEQALQTGSWAVSLPILFLAHHIVKEVMATTNLFNSAQNIGAGLKL